MASFNFREISVSNNVEELSSIAGTHATYDDADGFDSTSAVAQPIYGRDRETLQLLKTYETLLQSKQFQTVLVHGESGSGKTALVDVIRDPVCRSRGYFVAGKFAENSAVQEPYSAIMAVFSDLCDLIAQSDDFDENRRTEIQGALASDGQLLARAVTNLSPFIGESNVVTPIEPSFAKFKVACSLFLRTMASDEHPVVMLLDDIQWADKGSRLLLEMILSDSSVKNVMLILSFRDEESAQVVDILGYAKHHVDIALNNLDESAVHQMVSVSLGSNTDQVRDLSRLVAKRTDGHPYHVKMFIEFALQEGLLSIDEETQEWNFNVDTMQEEIMVSDSLASLLTRKIERLSPHVKEILKIASLLGYHFGGSILVDVACTAAKERPFEDDASHSFGGSEMSRESALSAVLAALDNAVKHGFIESTRDRYHFTHDKLQASFRSLLGEREEERLHASIGRAYILGIGTDESAVYNAAVHLNCAPDVLLDSEHRAKLARINFGASQYSMKKSAFVTAEMMLQKGLSALGEHGRWSEEHFDLTFEMMLFLAKLQIITGSFEECEKTTKEALKYSRTTTMRMQVISIEVDLRAARSFVNDGLFTDYLVLAKSLGIKMPDKVSIRHIAMKLIKVKLMLVRKSDHDLLSLPATRVDDLLTTTAMKLLVYICSYGLLTEQKETAIFAALLAMELTLKRGISPLSPFAFAIYGVSQISLGNTKCGYRFGKIALSVLEKLTSQEAACPTFGFTLTLLSCWKEPIRDLIDPLFQIGFDGFARGDTLFGAYCMAQSFAMQTIRGDNLEKVESAMRDTYDMVSEMGQKLLCLWYQPYLQWSINMRSDSGTFENVGILSGEIMQEEEFFRQAEEATNPLLALIAFLYKALEAAYFHDYELSVSFYEEAASFGQDAIRISHGAPNYYWSAAQVNFELFQSCGSRHYQRNGRKYLKKLKRMEADGCPNITPYLVFLEAERASRRKSISVSLLRSLYDDAITSLGESDFVHLVGLLNERAGFHFAERGGRAEAEQYFHRAMDIYMSDWGATAKYIWLQEKSMVVLSQLRETTGADIAFEGGYVTANENRV